MKEIDHGKNLQKIFKDVDPITLSFSSREGEKVEFKEAFNWGNRAIYAKSIAAFANNKGGYLIFGVTDASRKVVGLSSTNFENLDEATITSYLNSLFSPEVIYEKFSITVKSKKIGIIYTYELTNKPLIAIKNDKDIHEADIYYRYNARNDRIKYPELKKIFDLVREEERKSWMNLFEKVSKIGPENAGIVDVVKGTIDGKGGSILIDQKLASKLKFIKEGHFSEQGKPTLKLIGDVLPVSVTGKAKGISSTFRLTDDPSALAVREETILKGYPWDYAELIQNLLSRYSDFKTNNEFHQLKKKIMTNGSYSHPRYLDPKNPKGTKKDYYSPKILTEFDKHYTRAKKKK